MSEVILQGSALSKTYREGALITPVFEDLDVAVRAGESLAIVGASGTGKSTLLHLLAGLDQPTSGRVHLMGEDLYSHSEAEKGRLRNRHLGFIYQFHHLLPEFTAVENVMMPLLIAGKAADKARQPAIELLEQVGLGHRLKHKPGELSGGERQRVAPWSCIRVDCRSGPDDAADEQACALPSDHIIRVHPRGRLLTAQSGIAAPGIRNFLLVIGPCRHVALAIRCVAGSMGAGGCICGSNRRLPPCPEVAVGPIRPKR